MNKKRTWFGLFILTAELLLIRTTFAQEAKADEDGFYEPRSEVLARIKRVGLLPPRIAEFVGPRPEVKAHIEAQLAEKLTAAGITVIGSQAYAQAYDDMNRKVGGIYSALSGDLDRQKNSAVREHALRTFIESEKLDGVVEAAVIRVKASFYDNNTTWDGVTERTTGVPMNKNILKAMWYAPSGTRGTLPALSLAVVIRDTNNKPLYINFGGIQMTAYRNVEVKESYSSFVDVPDDQLLRDIPRVNRAIGIVTEPLLLSQEQRKAKERAERAARTQRTASRRVKGKAEAEPEPELPPLPEGVVPKEESPFVVPRDQILAKVKTVVLMTLMVDGLPREKETAVGARYRQYITAELARVGISVVDPGPLREAWRQEAGDLKFYDPYTGEFDKVRHSETRRRAYARAKGQVPFDGVIWPAVIARTAEYSYGTAQWDGVRQDLGSVEGSSWSAGSGVGGSGSVRALSLQLKLHDTDDAELYHTMAGIQVIEKISSGGLYDTANKSETLTPSQLFNSPQRDGTAVALSLRPLVLTPEELDAILHPPPPEKEQKGKKKKR